MNFNSLITGILFFHLLFISSVVDARTSAVNQGWIKQPKPSEQVVTTIGNLDEPAKALFTRIRQDSEDLKTICTTAARYEGLPKEDFNLAVATCYNNGFPSNLIYTDECRNTHKSTSSNGQPFIPTQTQVTNCNKEKEMSEKADWVIWKRYVEAYNNKGQVDTNLSGFSQSFYGSSSSTNLELKRFVWRISSRWEVPFYLLSSSAEADEQDSVKSKVLDNNSGTFNVQISGHKMMESSKRGYFCNHMTGFTGGCYYGFEGGAKLYNTDDTKFTMYLSAYFDYESSIFGEGKNNKAGTVKMGVSINAATNDADRIEEQLKAAGLTGDTSVKSSMLFLNFHLSANIDEYASISASYVPISSEGLLDDNLIYSLNYNAIEF